MFTPSIGDAPSLRHADDTALIFRDGRGASKGQNDVQPSPPCEHGVGSGPADSKWKLAVSRNGHMCWTDYLAVASDLQLIPRLMGVDALKVAVEQVFSAPHRVQARDGLVSVPTDPCVVVRVFQC